ncbi:hypothetical protein ISCGN_031349 [Ixodes scapularis]
MFVHLFHYKQWLSLEVKHVAQNNTFSCHTHYIQMKVFIEFNCVEHMCENQNFSIHSKQFTDLHKLCMVIFTYILDQCTTLRIDETINGNRFQNNYIFSSKIMYHNV